MRGDEVIARVGGEEFAWILPDADVDGALAAVKRCLAAVAAARFECAPSVTISGGICAASDKLTWSSSTAWPTTRCSPPSRSATWCSSPAGGLIVVTGEA